MAVNKITEVTTASALNDDASFLITQEETVGGQDVEALRRVSLEDVLEVTGSAKDISALQEGVENIVEKGPNLISADAAVQGYNGVVVKYQNGHVNVTGTANNSGGRTKSLAEVTLPAGTYTARVFNVNAHEKAYPEIFVQNKADSSIIASVGVQTPADATITLAAQTTVFIGVNVVSGRQYDSDFDFQLEKGSASTEYMPPFGSATDYYAREDLADLKSRVSILEPAATSSDVGKALKAKTGSGGAVTEWELGEAAIIDATLTQAGEAADAKATGDAIDGLEDQIGNTPMGTTATTITGAIAEHESDISGINTALAGKQATLTFDNVPTENSTNPVKSGGVYSAVGAKLDAPLTAGTAGQALVTDGNGGVSWNDVEIEVDDTLSQQGEAADAKATGDAISELSTHVTALDEFAFGEETTVTPTVVNKLNISANGSSYYNPNGYDTQYIPIQKGETWTLSVVATKAATFRYAFASSIPANGVSATYIKEVSLAKDETGSCEYTANADGYLSVSYYEAFLKSISADGTDGGASKTLNEHSQKIEALEETAEDVEQLLEDVSGLSDDVADLETDLGAIRTATVTDVGKVLSVKTVTSGSVTEWDFIDSDIQANYPDIDKITTATFINAQYYLAKYHECIREVKLGSQLWTSGYSSNTDTTLLVNTTTLKGQFYGSPDSTAYQGRTIGVRTIYLEAGDVIISNVDTIYDNETLKIPTFAGNSFINGYRGAIIGNCQINNETNTGNVYYAREAFDGKFRAYPITTTGYYHVSYRVDVSYTNKIYVYHKQSAILDDGDWLQDITDSIVFNDGYVAYNSSSGFNESAITDNIGASGRYQQKTVMLSLSGNTGKSLVVTGVNFQVEPLSGNPLVIHYEENEQQQLEPTTNYLVFQNHIFKTRNYITVPLTDSDDIRVQFPTQACPPFMRFYIVDTNVLKRKGLVNPVFYGKKIMGFGDSYIAGQGVTPTWHNLIALNNYGHYIGNGWAGAGLVFGGGGSLMNRLSYLDENADIYLLVFGRNDDSNGIRIGDNDDYIDDTQTWDAAYLTQQSFKGCMNYLFNYLETHHPFAKICMITPWGFENLPTVTSGLSVIDYVEAERVISYKWGISFFNAAGEAGIHVRIEAFRSRYFKENIDSSHLNQDGHDLMYRRSEKLLTELLYEPDE